MNYKTTFYFSLPKRFKNTLIILYCKMTQLNFSLNLLQLLIVYTVRKHFFTVKIAIFFYNVVAFVTQTDAGSVIGWFSDWVVLFDRISDSLNSDLEETFKWNLSSKKKFCPNYSVSWFLSTTVIFQTLKIPLHSSDWLIVWHHMAFSLSA